MFLMHDFPEHDRLAPGREHLRPGQHVSVVLKQDQASGATTEGIVERILTKSAFHPHGIKVKLSSGEVGRVKEIHD